MADDKEKPVSDGQNAKPTPTAAKPKKSAARKKAVTTGSTTTAVEVGASVNALNTELQELERLSRERSEAQDQRLSELLEGLEKTFGHIHHASSEQTQKLSSLMIGLEKTFHTIHTGTQSRDRSNSSSLEQLSQTIVRSSEELRKEYEELERLQEQKLAAEKERHQHSFNVLKVIAVPAMVLAVLGIGYMFYTVTVMERAMTAMSKDMNAMRSSMSEMTTSVGGMNQNVQGMRRDMGVLTHYVAPTMDGMRQMMPWAP